METRFDKNSTYTGADIANAIMAVTNRYQDFKSARCTVDQTINKLGIQSINGQKRNRYFSGLDAQRVFDAIPHESKTKQLPLIEEIPEKVTPVVPIKKSMLTLNTVGGIVYVNPSDISMISLPPIRYFFSFRGWGSMVTLRSGKQIHVKEKVADVKELLKKAIGG